jgi:hypothetical protein
VVPTKDREGRSEAASVAAGAAGRKFENSSHKRTLSEIFERKKM